MRGYCITKRRPRINRVGIGRSNVLISAGRLPLVHVEGAARLRVADLEAYVDALVPLDTEQSERANAD